MIKTISINSLRHLITAILTASVIARFGPSLFQRLAGWDPSNSNWLQVSANYAFGLIVLLSFVTIAVVLGWTRIRDVLGDKLVVLSIASVLISTVVNLACPRLMLLFLLPSAFLIFTIVPKCNIFPDERPAVAILLFLAVAPISLDILLGPFPGNYLSGSFRGFLQSRTDYAFVCVLALLVLLRNSSALSMILIILVSLGIAFSSSRAAYISVFVSVLFLTYYFIREKKHKKLISVAAAIVAVTLSPYVLLLGDFWKDVGQIRLINVIGVHSYEHSSSTENVGMLFDTFDRTEIYRRAFKEAVQNIWFGKGNYFQQLHINAIDVEAHNNVLQTVLNFGIFAALCWAALILRLFFSVSEYGRAIILSWLCFGLFQPGYDAFLFTPANFMVLLFSYVLVEREPIFASGAKGQVIV